VCLDHGLDDPRPRVAYKPIPIESYVKDPAVTHIIKLMLSRRIDQHSAQAAAWHLQNGLSFEELANKIGYEHRNGLKEPYFTAAQLERAIMATRVAKELAEQEGKDSGSSVGDKLAQPGE